MRSLGFVLLALGLAIFVVACSGGDDPSSQEASSGSGFVVVGPNEPPPFALQILAVPSFGDDRSAVVVDGGRLPARYTCDGEGVAPLLTWSGGSQETNVRALIFEDLDAEPEPYVHWVVSSLNEIDRPLTPNALFGEGQNDGGVEGYQPPCPPAGDGPHHYRYAPFASSSAGPSPQRRSSSGRRFGTTSAMKLCSP